MTKEEYERKKNLEYDKNSIRLAEVRFYCMEGLSIGRTMLFPEKEKVYAFLLKNGDHYANIISGEELPVYERCKAAMGENQTQDMYFHGSKLVLAYGEEKEGLCYVVDPFTNEVFRNEKVKFSEIVDYMVHSDKFFVDRSELIKNRIVPMYQKERIRTMLEDSNKLDKFNQYLEKKGKEYQYHK